MVAPILAAAIAPLAQKLISQGFNILAGAVTAKGKEVIEEKLGVDIESALESEEGRIQLRQMELDHEEFLITSSLEADKLEHANTDSARKMNTEIQSTQNASWLAKNFSYLLDMTIVGSTMYLAYLLMTQAIPADNKEIAFAAFGSLLTLCGTVVNFHRGSSSGSSRKNTIFESIMMRGGK